MNEKFTKEFKANINAVAALVEANSGAAEKLFRQQAELANDLWKANVAHAITLVDCKDVKTVVEANKAWGQDVNEKVVAVTKANMAVMEDVRGSTSELVEGLVKQTQSQVEATVEEAKAKVEETVKAVQGQVQKATKKAA
ncbi:MAG: phasin family protein [Gammaproteobacteria bacterium]|nr:phasin family protein [Gammaproteobacteria bacterium]